MKIEKINEQQIRCTLTKEDLALRHIKLSELAYGTEKTRALFRDMMEQASVDFGFEVDNIPLMVEAIPMSAEQIVLIITKVESPDELDTRFSEFSHCREPDDFFADEDFGLQGGADLPEDLADLLGEIRQELIDSGEISVGDGESAKSGEAACGFTFADMEEGISLARAIRDIFRGESAFYRDGFGGYALFISRGSHSLMEFNRICNAAEACLVDGERTASEETCFREYGKAIIPKHAVQTLAEL